METAEIISFFKEIPFWIVLFILYVYFFGDRKVWEYEVKFPNEAGIGRGEVELECLKKKGTQVELSFDLEPEYNHKPIEIFRNGISIYTVEARFNNKNRIFIKNKTPLEKPEEGDEITVKIDGKTVFSGRLVLD